jgi:hypothetical protein
MTTRLLPSRMREGSGEGLSTHATVSHWGHALPQPLPLAGGEL